MEIGENIDIGFQVMEFLRKNVFPIWKDFQQKPSINDQFQEILQDINDGKKPVIVADKIGTAIQAKFEELQTKMNPDEYYSFCSEVIRSIQTHLDTTVHVWRNRVINFKDVDEVWVTCEPMLDLVHNTDGTFEILQKQICYVNKIVYFMQNTTYFDDLVTLLQKRSIDTSKLSCVKLQDKYVSPVVIYHSQSNKHGMNGKSHPKLRKMANGFYTFTETLDPNWLQNLQPAIVNNHVQTLTQHKNQKS